MAHKKSKNKYSKSFQNNSPFNFNVNEPESYFSFGLGKRNGRAELVFVNASKYDLKRLFECYQAGEDTLKEALLKTPVMRQLAGKGNIIPTLEILLRDLPGFFEGEDVVYMDPDAYLENGGEL